MAFAKEDQKKIGIRKSKIKQVKIANANGKDYQITIKTMMVVKKLTSVFYLPLSNASCPHIATFMVIP